MSAAAPHLTKPEIACFLSHRKCWEIIAARRGSACRRL
ncbi:glycosyltransferase family 25 protein [Mesorhizobium atlanticum]